LRIIDLEASIAMSRAIADRIRFIDS